jgi:predicted acyltransferase
VKFDFSELRYGSVLGRIGLAWMFAAIIFLNTRMITRILWFSGLLLGYWILFLLFPAKDMGSTDIYSQAGNFASYIDRVLMPGKLYLGSHDPEGIMSTMPAIGTALLGMLTGEFLLSGFFREKPLKKVLFMAGVALFLMLIGKLWGLTFPINKNLWTSSFVCWVGGLSLLLFSLFYLIIDVWKYRKWSFFFVVIGMNPITIYLAERIINFRSANNFFFKGITEILPETLTPLINAIGLTTLAWLFLYILYKRKIFLKV